jgi:D-alanyl-lipoteichoic acid acyltransferase DltB (MBOAT superfamily)
MIFTTLTFMLFLALVFAVYWAVKDTRQQNICLLVAGYVFYGWWDYRFCALMLASSVADYSFGRALARSEQAGVRKSILAGSCLFNLALLGFFKYFNFFAESLSEVFQTLGWQLDVPTVRVILPVGISFYTFQSMSYVIDVYRCELQPAKKLVDYLTYVAFFPQLLAGPIERGKNLLPQILSHRQFDYHLAVDGLRLIFWGFIKKMVLADNLATCVDQAYADPKHFDGSHLALATVCFAFQIYGDFSGYSDIAVGTARLFGVRLMRNFAYPYFSKSVAEFWRRWHISLSTWFRDYLYIPLGGSRVGAARRVANVLVTFVISGLWHGAAWSYVLWGAFNGIGIIPSLFGTKGRKNSYEVPGGAGVLPSFGAVAGILSSFAFICVGWVFFRARTLADAGTVLSRIVFGPWRGTEGFTPFLTTKGLVVLIFIFVGVEWACRDRLHPLGLKGLPRPCRWTAYTLLIWMTLYLRPVHSGNFIYFQF